MSIFHRHHWETIAAEKLEYVYYQRRTNQKIGPDSPITELLQRCECGDVRTKTIDGHWTLDDRPGPAMRRDPVTAEVRDEVLRRDRGCVAPRLGAKDACSGRATLDHVKDQPRMGVRGPSDPAHLTTLCWHHHLDGWATSHRPELRAYLRALA